MTHRPPEPIRMIRTNRRFKVLWRTLSPQYGPQRDSWNFRTDVKPLKKPAK